jgi:hypothetical protein
LTLAQARTDPGADRAFARARGALVRPRNLVLIAIVLVAGWLVFVPLAALIYTAFTTDDLFAPSGFTLDNFRDWSSLSARPSRR